MGLYYILAPLCSESGQCTVRVELLYENLLYPVPHTRWPAVRIFGFCRRRVSRTRERARRGQRAAARLSLWQQRTSPHYSSSSGEIAIPRGARPDCVDNLHPARRQPATEQGASFGSGCREVLLLGGTPLIQCRADLLRQPICLKTPNGAGTTHSTSW